MRIKPEVETDTFMGHVVIDLSIKEQDQEFVNLHMKNLTVTKFQISSGEEQPVEGLVKSDDSFVGDVYSFKFANE